jgi:trigger factor
VKVTSQTLENRQVALTIEVEDERVQEELRRAAKHIANTTNIPGFRKGKAPYHIVLRTFGEDALYREVVDQIGEEVYRQALEQSNLDLYSVGHIDDVQLKPLVFKATVPLRPIVDLGDYRSLRVPFIAPEVSDEAMDKVLKDLQESNATLEPAGEGPVEWDQTAVLTVDGRLGPNEDAATIVHEHDLSMPVTETTGLPFSGFASQIIGMKVGEEKSFELVVPEDSDDEDLRGKTVYFEVKLEDLKVRRVPSLDDALAQTVGEYETLAALRENVRAGLLQQAMNEAESKYADECAQQLADQAHVEFPPQMVEEELDDMVERVEHRLSDQKMSLDEFLNIKKQSREEYREEMRPRAEKNVRRTLALGGLVEREKLDVADDEVMAAIESIAARYGENAAKIQEQLSSAQGQRSIKLNLLTAKVVGRLVSICKGENPPLPAEDEPAQATELLAVQPESAVKSN